MPRAKCRGGGVAVLHKSSLKVVKQKVTSQSSFEVTEVLISTATDIIRLIVVYRPPPGGKCSQPTSIFL